MREAISRGTDRTRHCTVKLLFSEPQARTGKRQCRNHSGAGIPNRGSNTVNTLRKFLEVRGVASKLHDSKIIEQLHMIDQGRFRISSQIGFCEFLSQSR